MAYIYGMIYLNRGKKTWAPALQDSPHTDPGGPVGRKQSRIDPISTSRIDPQSRPVDLVDLDTDTGQQEPVDLDFSGGIDQGRYPDPYRRHLCKNGVRTLCTSFFVFADSFHFAKIFLFNYRMHSIPKFSTKQKKGWFQKFRINRKGDLLTKSGCCIAHRNGRHDYI